MSRIVVPISPCLDPSRIISLEEYQAYVPQYDSLRLEGVDADLRNNNDAGYGYYGAPGGAGNEGTYVQYNIPPEGGGTFMDLESRLNATLKQNWRENGSNPLILETYRICGLERRTDSLSWCAAFMSYILYNSGFSSLKSTSSQAYRSYGREIDWRSWQNVRRNDIIVFRNKSSNGGHVGFFRGYNPSTNRVRVLGGNQGDTVKLSNFRTRGDLFVVNVKRNWEIPPEFDKPVIIS